MISFLPFKKKAGLKNKNFYFRTIGSNQEALIKAVEYRDSTIDSLLTTISNKLS